MSSNDDPFLDSSPVSARMMESDHSDCLMKSSPSSPIVPDCGPTPGSPSPTPPNPSCLASLSPPSPTPPFLGVNSSLSSDEESPNTKVTEDLGENLHINVTAVKLVKIEFLDDNGFKVKQTRYCQDANIIEILENLVRFEDPKRKSATVSKVCNSVHFKELVKKKVLQDCSQKFSEYLSSDLCVLKNNKLSPDFEDLSTIDLTEMYDKCLDQQQDFLSALSLLVFGQGLESITENNHLKQRLMAVIGISAFSRNQKINLVQKMFGEYFKLSNTGKKGLQLMQRLGLSLVPKSIRENQDVIGVNFLSEVKERRKSLEGWHERRKILESMAKKKKVERREEMNCGEQKVVFVDDKSVDQIVELGEFLAVVQDDLEAVGPDNYILELIEATGGEVEALEKHLDTRPKHYDVTFDNVDIGRVSCEYLIGQKDLSFHWTSSIIVEDIVDAREISDEKVERKESKFEDRINLSKPEKEHLLQDYTQLLLNIIKVNWPTAFPNLALNRIKHQYSEEFEGGVKVWTGPLVCENESNLEGMAKIITNLTDELCPVTTNREGVNIPISPTTLSGDQKTEKASRSAQIALMDNGSMRDKLAFIEGRHELLHFMFMFCDVILDIFADQNNLEEASCLSRLIQQLNPKLSNKKGKDAFYPFRDAYSDIFVAQLEESLCRYLGVPNLLKDVTPDNIRLEPDQAKKMLLFQALMRKFIIETHTEYMECDDVSPRKPILPLYYPHEKFVRKNKQQSEPVSEDPIRNQDGEKKLRTKKVQKEKEVDAKNDYFRALFSILGSFQLLLDSIKEGNGLNCYLLQKKVLKIVQATGHKNYSCSTLAYKNIVLNHSNPQFSHRFLWNVFAGRPGKSNKFPRDMKNEHLNRYLKDAFRSLGVNLNPKNAKRVNNSADVGIQIEHKVNDFFDVDTSGKSHSKKSRVVQLQKLGELFKREECSNVTPGRVFRGPGVKSDVFSMFDEAKYRVWHLNKEKELLKIQRLKENYFTSR